MTKKAAAGADSIAAAFLSAAAYLRDHADPVAAPQRKRYLKSPYDMLGCSVPTIRTAAKNISRACPEPGLEELITAMEKSWASRVHEDRLLAAYSAQYYRDRFALIHVEGLFKNWLIDSHNWDFVDTICSDTVGRIALNHPQIWKEIESWSKHDWVWLRRASLVCHLPTLRKDSLREELQLDQIHRTIDRLVDEQEFFIRKAIGWILREMSKKYLDETVALIEDFGPRASGLTIREATKHMPDELGKSLRAKYL